MYPYNAHIDTVLELKPDGVLVSNGPGDPEPLHETITLMRELLKQRIPLVGICLGHQLLGLALGGTTYKMRFGHRGVNHPVKDLHTGSIVITTQNHGFAVDPTSLGISWTPLDAAFTPARPELGNTQAGNIAGTMAERLPETALTGESPLGFGKVEVTHLSLNDGTLEGLSLMDGPAFLCSTTLKHVRVRMMLTPILIIYRHGEALIRNVTRSKRVNWEDNFAKTH